jgi:hypothetical protein
VDNYSRPRQDQSETREPREKNTNISYDNFEVFGWAGVIWDGPWKIFGQFRWAANFFVCPWLGHQTKTHVNYILHKDIDNKSKQNYPNYQMQMMLLKPVL